MWVVPLATALAVGIFLGMILWEHGAVSCDLPWVPLLQTSLVWRLGLSLLAVAFMPLIAPSNFTPLPQKREQPQLARGLGLWALRLGLYAFWGVLIAWSRPTYPCFPPGHIATIVGSWGDEGRYVTLSGTVSGWPEPRGDHNRYLISVDELVVSGQRYPVQGAVLVRAPAYPLLEYGTLARFRGYLRAPPVFEDFDYRRYLARRGVYAVLRAYEVIPLAGGRGSLWQTLLYAARSRGHELINTLFLQPYAGLVNGILLGIESDIPPPLMDAFNATGTSHILVISGFNISVLAGLVIGALGPWLGRRRAALAAIAAVALYVPLVGGEAAVVRAGIMGSLYALATVLGRQTFGIASLFWAAVLMLAFNPHVLWDVGFQLSFLATLGLLVLHPPLAGRGERLLAILPRSWRSRVYAAANEAIFITVAAHLATAPLIAAVFGRTSLIAILANALILPVQPPLMATAALTVAAGLVWLPLGQWLAVVPQALLAWTLFVVERMARWPGAGWPVPEGIRTLAIPYYGLFGAYVAWVWYRTVSPEGIPKWEVPSFRFRVRRFLGWLAIASALAIALLVTRVTATSAVRWRVIRFPSGQVILQRWDVRVAFIGPILDTRPVGSLQGLPTGRRTVWVITHADAATLAKLRLALQSQAPALVLYPAFCVPEWPCPGTWYAFLQALAAYQVPAYPLAPGTAWQVTPGLSLAYAVVDPEHPLYPVWVRSKGWALLLPDDIPVSMQEKLSVVAGRTVWVLPGVASKTWPTPGWIARLRPALLWRPDDVRYPPSVEAGLPQGVTRLFDASTTLTFSFPPEDDRQP